MHYFLSWEVTARFGAAASHRVSERGCRGLGSWSEAGSGPPHFHSPGNVVENPPPDSLHSNPTQMPRTACCDPLDFPRHVRVPSGSSGIGMHVHLQGAPRPYLLGTAIPINTVYTKTSDSLASSSHPAASGRLLTSMTLCSLLHICGHENVKPSECKDVLRSLKLEGTLYCSDCPSIIIDSISVTPKLLRFQ